MTRLLPAAITLIGYLALTIGLALFDPRLTLVAIGAIAVWEGREATRA